MSESVMRMASVAAGGAMGSVLRYVISGAMQRSVAFFPIGTLTVNVTGCFAIGLLSELFADSSVDPVVRTAVLVGVLGGFTTFSTFSFETLKLAENRQYDLAVLNAVVSLFVCLAGTFAGQRLGRWWMLG